MASAQTISYCLHALPRLDDALGFCDKITLRIEPAAIHTTLHLTPRIVMDLRCNRFDDSSRRSQTLAELRKHLSGQSFDATAFNPLSDSINRSTSRDSQQEELGTSPDFDHKPRWWAIDRCS